ncbi:MAG: hypothetical protein AB7G17_07675 [Phycisphaerales bacterium]
MARLNLEVGAYRTPVWKRRGVWLGAALGVALLPAVAALVVRVLPSREAPAPRERAPLPPVTLQTLHRPPAGDAAVQAIAGANAFSADRKDWARPAAVEVAGASGGAEDRLKLAMEALDRMTFVGVVRVGDEWRAMVDPGSRKPGEDYLMVGPGGDVAGWTVRAVGREGATLGFEETEKVVAWGPKPKPAAPITAPTGRIIVDVREASGKVLVDPPISLDEARRRMEREVSPQDRRLRELLDELLESLKNEQRRSPGA